MKITTKQTKDGLLLQATEKRNGKTVTRPLKKLPFNLAIGLRSHNSIEAHQRWLADTAAKLRRYYNEQEGPDEDWDDAEAVEFFIRDLFYGDTQAMQEVVGQCLDWLQGIHHVDIAKWLKRSKWVNLKSGGRRARSSFRRQGGSRQ